jgi:hypothetical protein
MRDFQSAASVWLFEEKEEVSGRKLSFWVRIDKM